MSYISLARADGVRQTVVSVTSPSTFNKGVQGKGSRYEARKGCNAIGLGGQGISPGRLT